MRTERKNKNIYIHSERYRWINSPHNKQIGRQTNRSNRQEHKLSIENDRQTDSHADVKRGQLKDFEMVRYLDETTYFADGPRRHLEINLKVTVSELNG